MTHTARLAREDAITEALRAADAAIGEEQPTSQAMRIIEAIKRLRADGVRVTSLERVDYLRAVQSAAQAGWMQAHGAADSAGSLGYGGGMWSDVDTPLGALACLTWRMRWRSGKIAWCSEYLLDGKPITVAEIRAAGLAQRPTTRRRQRRP